MKKNHLAAYQRPQATIFRVGLCLPLAVSLANPGGTIPSVSFGDDDGSSLDTPSGTIPQFSFGDEGGGSFDTPGGTIPNYDF